MLLSCHAGGLCIYILSAVSKEKGWFVSQQSSCSAVVTHTDLVWNRRDWVEGFTGEGGLPGALQEPQSLGDELLDSVMLSLRLADGLDMADISDRHGVVAAERISKSLERHISRGLVEVVEGSREYQLREGVTGRSLRLTDPAGFLLSNDVISDVFVALSDDEDD